LLVSAFGTHITLSQNDDIHISCGSDPGVTPADGLMCYACEAAIGKIESIIEKEGCAWVASHSKDVCKIFGPFKTNCETAVVKYCPVILKAIENKSPPLKVCQLIKMCDKTSALVLEEAALEVDLGDCKVSWACVLHPKQCWTNCKCSACKFILGKVENQIAKEGCALVDAELTGLCETFGLGPEDPMSDICSIAFIAACPALVKLIEGGIKNPAELCQKVSFC